MSRYWWQDADIAEAEPPAPEYRGTLQRKLMLMRPRSPDRRAVERRLVQVTADLLRLDLGSGR